MTRKVRILVVDDEPDVVSTLTVLLEDEGYEVRGLQRGTEVLPEIAKFNPYAVLLDIAMPDMSGYEVAKAIRERYGVVKPLLIAISGRYKAASDKMLAQIVGFDHHVTKPYQPKELLELLHT
jgi:DNA-binding response OmpR family regulator